ncbi:MAG: sigma-54-dependent transcriptional regulator [Myxococcota bacterium]
MARILICDDEASLREMLGVLFRRQGHEVDASEGVAAALERIRGTGPPYDVVITDLMMPDGSGMDVLEAARATDEAIQVVMITAYATTERAVEAMRKGAYDYIQKPFRNDELLATVEKALEKRAIVHENRALRSEVEGRWREGDLVGKGAGMQKVRDLVRRVASAPTSVLLTGESGTGKEMVARALHYQGDRKDGPFVVVNCGALPESLMESELFGHEKGAFTGATTRKEGLVRAAEGGTLFLDEIGELPSNLQVKLLRVLQDRRVRPVGAEREVPVDVRVVTATNRDLEQDVDEGRFRQDLFYRLNVIRIHLPALRERPEDIALLAEHFLRKHCAVHGKALTFSSEALRWLSAQRYPGNVRELENLIERAVTLAEGERVERADLPEGGDDAPPLPGAPLPEEGFSIDAYLADIEQRLLQKALEQAGGVRTRAARLLGTSPRSARYRFDKYGIGGSDEDGGPDEP